MTYAELVETAKKEICARKHYGNSKLLFDRCETWLNSDQINLYAYWQGYQIKNKEDGIDILLVGQDWGHNPDHDPAYLADLKRIRLGIDKEPKRDSTNITNNNLGEMFSYLGIDIYKYDCGKRVFFTNYSLGYRPVDVSESGLMTHDLLKQDKKLFEMLVEVLKPKVIICLGQMVYETVSGKYTVENNRSIWKKHLSTGEPFKAEYPLDRSIKVYGVPHCGRLGVINVGGKANMVNIWKSIAEEIETI